MIKPTWLRESGSSAVQMSFTLAISSIVTIAVLYLAFLLYDEAVITARIDGALARCDWATLSRFDGDSEGASSYVRELILEDCIGLDPQRLTVRIDDFYLSDKVLEHDLSPECVSAVRGAGYAGHIRQKWEVVHISLDVDYVVSGFGLGIGFEERVLSAHVDREAPTKAEVVLS